MSANSTKTSRSVAGLEIEKIPNPDILAPWDAFKANVCYGQISSSHKLTECPQRESEDDASAHIPLFIEVYIYIYIYIYRSVVQP